MRRTLLSLAALAGAVLLVALASDALAWERHVAADDRRFTAAPASPRLWSPPVVLPGRAAERVLAVGDDVEYRRMLRRYWPVRPGRALLSPELEAQRGQVEAELARVSAAAAGPRRAHALNLLGLFVQNRYAMATGGTASAPPDPAERAMVFRQAVGLYQAAVEADPANADAKRNLELILRTPPAAEFIGDDPSGSAAEGSGTGAGRGGSGW